MHIDSSKNFPTTTYIRGKIPSYSRLEKKNHGKEKHDDDDDHHHHRTTTCCSGALTFLLRNIEKILSVSFLTLTYRARNLLQVMVDRMGIQAVNIDLVHHHEFHTLGPCKTFNCGTFLWPGCVGHNTTAHTRAKHVDHNDNIISHDNDDDEGRMTTTRG
jgi:hypothetical protein